MTFPKWLPLVLTWLGLAGPLGAESPSTPRAPRPNIVFVLCDDLGYGDVQCLAPETSRIPTPHADRLAREGRIFTDAHSGSSVCSPTRYGLLTGRYSWRTRLQQGVVTGYAPSLIAADRPTLGTHLQALGYHTAVIGKWHLDFQYLDAETGQPLKRKQHPLPPVGARIPDGPTTRGFDRFHGFHHARDMRAVIDGDRVVEHDDVINMLPRLQAKAVQYIEERAAQEQPFFLYLPLGSPHTPIVPSAEWQGKSGLGDYGDFVMQTDAALGAVLAAVDRHQLAGNTLVLFSSDNGCSKAAGIEALARQGHLVSAQLRGSKADSWEGGHRVPFVVRWPGQIPAGTQSDHTLCLTDVFATLSEMLESELPPGSCEDSFSFYPAMTGQAQPPRPAGVIHHSISGHFGFRQGPWKLILARGSGGWSSPNEKQVPADAPVAQLYHLGEDLGEQSNRYLSQPQQAAAMLDQLTRDVQAGRTRPGPDSANDLPSIELWKSEKRARRQP